MFGNPEYWLRLAIMLSGWIATLYLWWRLSQEKQKVKESLRLNELKHLISQRADHAEKLREKLEQTETEIRAAQQQLAKIQQAQKEAETWRRAAIAEAKKAEQLTELARTAAIAANSYRRGPSARKLHGKKTMEPESSQGLPSLE